MRRLSSHLTFFYKRILPAIWLGLVVLMCGCGVMASLANQIYSAAAVCAGSMVFMLAGGNALFRFRFPMFNYVDEVWDCESHLLIKNGDIEDTVPYRDCLEVKPDRFHLTISFKRPTRLGTQIVFAPQMEMEPSVARLLQVRIEAAMRNAFPKPT